MGLVTLGNRTEHAQSGAWKGPTCLPLLKHVLLSPLHRGLPGRLWAFQGDWLFSTQMGEKVQSSGERNRKPYLATGPSPVLQSALTTIKLLLFLPDICVYF